MAPQIRCWDFLLVLKVRITNNSNMVHKYKCLRQWFSTNGDFASTGNMWQYLWNFCCHNGRRLLACSEKRREIRQISYNAQDSSFIKKKYSAQNVNSNTVKVGKLWCKVILKANWLNSSITTPCVYPCTWRVKDFYLKRLSVYVNKIQCVLVYGSLSWFLPAPFPRKHEP